MRAPVTTDLKRLSRELQFGLRGLMRGNLTESGREDISDALEFIFGTRNPYQIARILEFCGELYAIERGEDDGADTA
jgi:hypothetical protein